MHTLTTFIGKCVGFSATSIGPHLYAQSKIQNTLTQDINTKKHTNTYEKIQIQIQILTSRIGICCRPNLSCSQAWFARSTLLSKATQLMTTMITNDDDCDDSNDSDDDDNKDDYPANAQRSARLFPDSLKLSWGGGPV